MSPPSNDFKSKEFKLKDDRQSLKKLKDEGRRYSPNEIDPIGGSPGKIFKRVEAFKKKNNNSVNT